MVLYGVRLLINIFDLFIYRRFLEVFIGKRKTSVEFSIFLLIVCEVVGSVVNQLGINWLNFVTMLAILSVYICQYEAKLRSKVITVCLYMGLVVIAEPIGYIVYRILARGVFEDDVVSCFLLIEIARDIISEDTMILCMCVIFSIVVTNYIVFLIVHKYTGMVEKRLEEEMIYQEIAYNDEYYQDVEKYQEQIQDIKHDMKNKLAVLYDGVERGEREFVRDTLAEMLGDIRLAIIYSANPILNSLLKVKTVKAREKGIEMNVKVLVPKRMSVNSGDMGVIYGNLIDNAIEACTRVPDGKRFVDIETKYQDGKLLIIISNSKENEANPDFITTKEDKRRHGRGIRSVRRVAEQYGGELLLEDEGDTFRASLLLTNVECLE